jgi:hypothetical protein
MEEPTHQSIDPLRVTPEAHQLRMDLVEAERIRLDRIQRATSDKPTMPEFTKDISALHSLPADQPSDQAVTKSPMANTSDLDQAAHVESICEGARRRAKACREAFKDVPKGERYVIGHKGPDSCFVCDPADLVRDDALFPDPKVGTRVKRESDTRQGSPLGLESLRAAFRVPNHPEFLRHDYRNIEDRLFFPGKSLEESITLQMDPFPKITKQITDAGGKVLCAIPMSKDQAVEALSGNIMVRRVYEVMASLKPALALMPIGLILVQHTYGVSVVVVTQEDV